MRELNRMITGEMWKVKPFSLQIPRLRPHSVHFSIGAVTVIWPMTITCSVESTIPTLNSGYNTEMPSIKLNDGPYDCASPRGPPSVFQEPASYQPDQPDGQTMGCSLKTTTGMEMMFGIFQHFNYFDSEK